MPSARGALLLAGLAAVGCSQDYPNPFAQINRSQPPPAGAALVVPTGMWSAEGGAPRELFALEADGGNPTQLTFCNQVTVCDFIDPVPSPDRNRMMARRSTGEGGDSLVFLNLERSAEATLVPADQGVTGADWSPQDGVVVFSARGEGGLEDLFRMDPSGQNIASLTPGTPSVRERRPRIDPSGAVAVYERIESGGKGSIYLFQSSVSQLPITSGGPGEGVLPGSFEIVGSDTDPDFSPDAGSVVFRRLTAVGDAGVGNWDILTIGLDGTNLAVIASGPVFRGAPDWGPRGIVFAEIDPAAGTARLVRVAPDGSDRQVLLTQPASTRLGAPRWLP